MATIVGAQMLQLHLLKFLHQMVATSVRGNFSMYKGQTIWMSTAKQISIFCFVAVN